MTLFKFIKKRTETTVNNIAGKTGVDLIGSGILFEQDVFLRSGADIESQKLYTRKEYRADRTIYHWGERAVLNGLILYFKTVCWNHKQNGDTKSFESIDFLSEDAEAGAIFNKAKTHLTEIFGEPKLVEEGKQSDIALEWKKDAVKISLSIFDKECKKVHLEIGWWL